MKSSKSSASMRHLLNLSWLTYFICLGKEQRAKIRNVQNTRNKSLKISLKSPFFSLFLSFFFLLCLKGKVQIGILEHFLDFIYKPTIVHFLHNWFLYKPEVPIKFDLRY